MEKNGPFNYPGFEAFYHKKVFSTLWQLFCFIIQPRNNAHRLFLRVCTGLLIKKKPLHSTWACASVKKKTNSVTSACYIIDINSESSESSYTCGIFQFEKKIYCRFFKIIFLSRRNAFPHYFQLKRERNANIFLK